MTDLERFINWCNEDLTQWFINCYSEDARQRYNKMSNDIISKDDWHICDEITTKSDNTKYVIYLRTHSSIHPKYNSNNLIIVYNKNAQNKYQWCEFRCMRMFNTLEEMKTIIGGN